MSNIFIKVFTFVYGYNSGNEVLMQQNFKNIASFYCELSCKPLKDKNASDFVVTDRVNLIVLKRLVQSSMHSITMTTTIFISIVRKDVPSKELPLPPMQSFQSYPKQLYQHP